MMNRREALQRIAEIMGGAISAPAMLGFLNGCSAKPSSQFRPQFLDESLAAVVAEIADIMIPRTATPGARDVGVPGFIDSMLKDVYSVEDQQRYVKGLSDFESTARSGGGRSFLELDPGRRAALVQAANDAAVAAEIKARDSHEPLARPFILMTKELCMLGFFTSEVGATQVLQYVAIPGAYHGCIAVSEAGNGKTWARETSYSF